MGALKKEFYSGDPMLDEQDMNGQKLGLAMIESAKQKSKIEVIFEFSVLKPKPTLYRGVRAVDGSFRMEKRGQSAKKFRATMQCGSVESLFKFRESVEFYCGKLTRRKRNF